MTGWRIKGRIRRSQLISTYGIGSVVASGDESFMIAGLDYWKITEPDVSEPRLARVLKVSGFVRPPASEDDDWGDIPVFRFPEWVFCPDCARLAPFKDLGSKFDTTCNCGQTLVPSRFVVACAGGHVDDFPYLEWVHHGAPSKNETHRLKITTRGKTASLADIVISCSCSPKMQRSMQGAFSADALKGIYSCRRRRPWLLDRDPGECTRTPRTLQRGASNVYFSVVESAISIPPWSEGAFKLITKHWPILKGIKDDAILKGALAGLAQSSGYSVEDLLQVVKRKRDAAALTNDDPAALRKDEYEALVRGRKEDARSDDFVCEPADHTPISAWFDQVMQVKRLREVRALRGFTRVLPLGAAETDDQASVEAPLSRGSVEWLPAVEVIGEGIFLRLDQGALRHWELDDAVAARIRPIADRYRDSWVGRGNPRPITPRLVLIHTLAHILITRLALDSGYPAASLRERLYISDDMAALLIYTATTDSAGSLGGLIAQAEPERLAAVLRDAVTDASWCSGDPLCVEADAAGVDSLNLAACHACVLLPEVSCEESNVLLDRALLVGTPHAPELGFFRALIGQP